MDAVVTIKATPTELRLVRTALQVWAGSEQMLGDLNRTEARDAGVTPERQREAKQNAAEAQVLLGKL
jgi:hypothetical protein